MGAFRFVCPTHEREFDAGFEVDDDTFRRHRLKLVRISCPWCERTHRFLLADARRIVSVAEAGLSDIMVARPATERTPPNLTEPGSFRVTVPDGTQPPGAEGVDGPDPQRKTKQWS
jgi:hypothetical protein